MATSKQSATASNALSARAMRGGLTALRLASNAPVVERLGLQPVFNRMIFEGARLGYGAISALATPKPSTGNKTRVHMDKPSRPTQFDLQPTDEQAMMQETVRRFAQDKLLDAAREADDANAVPAKVVAAWNELGMAEMLLPEAYGGYAEERSPVSVALVLEALAYGDAGMAWSLLASTSAALLLLDHGTEAQKEKYLQGFTGDTPTVASIAMMERTPLFDPRKLKTRAEEVRGGWVLQGRKSLVARAADASFFIVSARTPSGPALFIVHADAEGLSIQEEAPMGLRSASVADVVLNSVVVDGDALVGDAISHQSYHDVIRRSRTAWAAVSSGAATRVAEYVRDYANDRMAFGEPISHRQAVAFLIADMAIETESIRLAMLRAASQLEHGLDADDAVGVARILAAEKGMFVGTNGVQLLGGHGFVKEFLMELWYRHLRGAGILEGGLYL